MLNLSFCTDDQNISIMYYLILHVIDNLGGLKLCESSLKLVKALRSEVQNGLLSLLQGSEF